MIEPESLLFVSDAVLVASAGGVLLLLASIATLADRRRSRRRSVDNVGCMPWTPIFLACAFSGAILLAFGVSGWISG